MSEQDRHNLFSEMMGRHQSELYAYIFSIVRNWEDTDDLFQSVCLTLWSKFDSFRPGSSFIAWARQTAKLNVRYFLRKKQLRHHVSDDLLTALTETTTQKKQSETGIYLEALRHCKEKLDMPDRDLLEMRYAADLGSRQIADRLNRPQQSVCNSITRIQRWLFRCVQMEIARDERSGGEGK